MINYTTSKGANVTIDTINGALRITVKVGGKVALTHTQARKDRFAIGTVNGATRAIKVGDKFVPIADEAELVAYQRSVTEAAAAEDNALWLASAEGKAFVAREIAAAEYDRGMNEGREGYNPHRAAGATVAVEGDQDQ